MRGATMFYGIAKWNLAFTLRTGELAAIFPQDTDTEKESFDLLCRAYIEARYNIDFSIPREQLEYLISRVEILKNVTERLCKEKLAEYDALANKE